MPIIEMMGGSQVYVFRPDLGLGEWIAVITPLLICGAVVAAGAWLACSFRSRQKAGASFLVCAACALIGSLMLAVSYNTRDRIATLTFSDDTLSIDGPFRHEKFDYHSTNRIAKGGRAVVLISQGRSVRLPESGTWYVQDLSVEADYLANEFIGRSRAQEPDPFSASR